MFVLCLCCAEQLQPPVSQSLLELGAASRLTTWSSVRLLLLPPLDCWPITICGKTQRREETAQPNSQSQVSTDGGPAGNQEKPQKAGIFIGVWDWHAVLQAFVRVGLQTRRRLQMVKETEACLWRCSQDASVQSSWHAGCRGNMRVSLVKCRSCRTGCSCTAETGICTVPGGAVRNT